MGLSGGGRRGAFCLFLSLAAAAALLIPSAAAANHDPSIIDLVTWFTSREGAVFNPKQEIRALPADVPSITGLGVFATSRIEEGELLYSVPRNMIVRVDKDDDQEDYDSSVSCATIRKLVDEMKVASRRTGTLERDPYMRYLLRQKRGQIPSAWSEAGRELLKDVLGGGTFPPDQVDGWVPFIEDHCNLGDDPDKFQENAAMLAVQRSRDSGVDGMMPLYDLYFHRNGRYLNTFDHQYHQPGTSDRHQGLSASRVIEEGEQIHTSLNNCTSCDGVIETYGTAGKSHISFSNCSSCGGIIETYGTAEIFRETGVVERLPQHWIFTSREFAFDLVEKEDGSGDLEVSWRNNVNITNMGIAFLRKEILRLERLQRLEEDNAEVPKNYLERIWQYSKALVKAKNKHDIPEEELEKIWQYSNALVTAMNLALKSALRKSGESGDDEATCIESDSADGACTVSDGYDALEDEEDDLYWDEDRHQNLKPISCETDLTFADYTVREEVQSIYQAFQFDENNETDDMCLDIDRVVQICSNYRPHYHEFNMDFPARYVDNVRRVVFIGGGDSMLLYEALKYPNIELVVGLELDQMVVRKSFKYFHTQPHFDDDRVEWWFGDATKSLLMLPKHYFGSFDLVLVDLSETVMSFSVTDGLDVFESVALLLNPDTGVMAKNELHMEKMSTIFDFTAQIYVPDLPTICDQVVVMGSNNANFFKHAVKDHNVNTLLLEPLDQIEDRLFLFHDYRKNDARSQGKCNITERPAEETNDTDEEMRHAGVLMIVDVEDTTVPLLPLAKIEGALSEALEKEGLSPLSTVAPSSEYDGAVAVIIMKEGYVVARVWSDRKYCAFDIHLWGAFNKMKSVRDALVAAVGSSTASMSSFRIVVGGMLGTNTWKEDQKSIGPRNIQMRNCEDATLTKEVGYVSDQKIADIALEEILTLHQDDGAVAAVLCGVEGEACRSLEVLANRSTFGHVIPLWTCPDIAKDPQYSKDVTGLMISCERDTTAALKGGLSNLLGQESIAAFIVDASAPVPMVKIANSIWSSQRMIELLAPRVLFTTMMLDQSETWRKKHNFLDRTRRTLELDPISSAELVLSSTEGKMEIGVLYSGEADFFRHLDNAMQAISKRSSLDVEVRKIQGGLIRQQEESYNPRVFKRADYNNRPGIEQFSKQQSLGRQSVFQLDLDEEDVFSSKNAMGALGDAISEMKYSLLASQISSDVGDGLMIVSVFSEGSAMVVWDGSKHFDINLFTYDESERKATQFVDFFVAKMPGLKMSLRDDMPRGIGRVVNFAEDMVLT